VPQLLADVESVPDLVVTVCDEAHEELALRTDWLHWSIADPVADGTRAAFDAAVSQLRHRITGLIDESTISS
jgi:protein-tyrosine-phosphatase